ncbi:ABC transporter permease [bacterium]|nr:ABC transporter permease [bacterium]
MASPALSSDAATSAGAAPGAARRRMAPATILSLGVLAAFALLAIAAPWVWHGDPLSQLLDGLDAVGMPLPPSWAHPMGTDDLGRDVLARWLVGARASLWVGLSATALAGIIGGAVGILSGYFKGWVDLLLMRLTEIVMAFPTLLLAIGLAAVLPSSPWMVVLTLGLVGWTAIARVVRASALSVREQEFIGAAEATGASHAWILAKHVLPNVMPILASLLTLKLADMLLLEAALSFLGLGVRLPEPSWGNMMQGGQAYFYSAPWLIAMPGFGILAVVLAANVLGDRWGQKGKA